MPQEPLTIEERLERIERLLLLSAKRVYDIHEAAAYLGRSYRRLHAYVEERAIPHYKKNGRLFFKREELDEWLTSNRIHSQKEIELQAEAYISKNY